MTKRKFISSRLEEAVDVQDDGTVPLREIKTLSVRQWHPRRQGQGPPTKLHLCLEIEGLPMLVLRLHSAEVTDALIEALVTNRQEVWPSDA